METSAGFCLSLNMFFFSQRPTWKRFLAHAGPGFLISLAYLDPSNGKMSCILEIWAYMTLGWNEFLLHFLKCISFYLLGDQCTNIICSNAHVFFSRTDKKITRSYKWIRVTVAFDPPLKMIFRDRWSQDPPLKMLASSVPTNNAI